MSNNVQVKFSVTGGELNSYLSEIKKKSDALTASAIQGAIEQNKHGKEQILLINEQIKAIERKTRMEGQAFRSIVLDRQSTGLQSVRDRYEGQKNDVYSDTKLSEKAKKEKIVGLEGSQKEAELNIKNQYRENLNYVRENERQAKLQTQLAKEQIDTLKETAAKNVKAISTGDLKLEDVISKAQSSDEKLVARITEESIREKKKEKDNNDGSRVGGGGVFNDILRAESFNRVLDSGAKLVQSKNGFDFISEALSIPTGAISTLASDIPGLSGITKLADKAATALAEFVERQAVSRQGYLKEQYRYNAVTGTDSGNSSDLSMSGVGATEFLKYRSDFARKRGYSSGSNETARDAIYAEKAYGVDQSTSANIVEMQRSSREGNKELSVLISGILEKGKGNIFKDGDHTFLNEFLGKFSTIQRELLKSQTHVATGTTLDILGRFNKVGGEFDVRDSRSMGNINAIQQGLANPSSDNMKALAFRALSEQNPKLGLFGLREQMQAGLASGTYLKGMLGYIDRFGGDEDMKMNNLSGMFPGLSLSAVRRLYNNKDKLMSGKMSMEELKGSFPGDFKERAEANTTQMDSGAADIETKILGGTMEALKTLGGTTRDAILDAFSGAVININGQKGTIEFERPALKKNNNNNPHKWVLEPK